MDNSIVPDQNLYSVQTVIYSFVAGYAVSEVNILGFVLGCGFMLVFHHMPGDIKKLRDKLYNNIGGFVPFRTPI